MSLKLTVAVIGVCLGFQALAADPIPVLNQLAGSYACPIPFTSMTNKMSIEKRDGKIFFLNFSNDVHPVTDSGLDCGGFDIINAVKTEQLDASGSIIKTTLICTANNISKATEVTPSNSKDKIVNSISITKSPTGVSITGKRTEKDQTGKYVSAPPVTLNCSIAK